MFARLDTVLVRRWSVVIATASGTQGATAAGVLLIVAYCAIGHPVRGAGLPSKVRRRSLGYCAVTPGSFNLGGIMLLAVGVALVTGWGSLHRVGARRVRSQYGVADMKHVHSHPPWMNGSIHRSTIQRCADEIAERITGRLGGWRRVTAERTLPDGTRVVEVSGGEGLPARIGNLVFPRLALLGIPSRLHPAQGVRLRGHLQSCRRRRAGRSNTDRGVRLFRGRKPCRRQLDLSPFCFKVDDFGTFLPNGQPSM